MTSKLELRGICPECGSLTQSGKIKPKFYLNPDTGAYKCFHCGYSGYGNVTEEDFVITETVQAEEFDDKAANRLLSITDDPKALAYIQKRFPGFNLDELDSFRLGYHVTHQAIAIPNVTPSGQIVGIKYRKLDPDADPKYLSETGSKGGEYWLSGTKDKLLVVEGEFDAITARLCGFRGTILALQTNRLRDSLLNEVKGYKNVFIALDNDKAGQEGQNSIAGILERLNPIPVTLPDGIKDLNELLQQKGIEFTQKFIQTHTETEFERETLSWSSRLTEMVDYLAESRNMKGDSTGYTSLDRHLGGGLRPGEMTLIVAEQKVGKSTFINNLIHNLAKLGKKVGLASFEMPPTRYTYPSLLSIAGQINLRRFHEAKDELIQTIELIGQSASYLNNIVTWNKFGHTTWEQCQEWAKYSILKHQLDYIVFDHSLFMLQDVMDTNEHHVLASGLKELTNINPKLHIILVGQARDERGVLAVYGSRAYNMHTDNKIELRRAKDNEDCLEAAPVYVRFPGGRPTSTPILFFYDRETCTLNE